MQDEIADSFWSATRFFSDFISVNERRRGQKITGQFPEKMNKERLKALTGSLDFLRQQYAGRATLIHRIAFAIFLGCLTPKSYGDLIANWEF